MEVSGKNQYFGIGLTNEIGITKCDMIAESIIAAAKDYLIGVEVVVRLQGTNAEAGLKMVGIM